MAISSLACLTMLSPNCSSRQGECVCKFTPHYMGGNCSVEVCGEIFAPASRQASSNYGIGSDGRIACYVDEDDRAWTSSSGWNDRKAVTVEVANYDDCGHVTDEAWNSLVELGADVCRRYGFRLDYTGDRWGSLTEHRMFSSTDCPGEYLHSQMERLAREVNARLDGGAASEPTPEPETERIPEMVNTALFDVDGTHYYYNRDSREFYALTADEYNTWKGVGEKDGSTFPEYPITAKSAALLLKRYSA